MDKYAELARRVLKRTRHVAAPPLHVDRERLEGSVERALAGRARRLRGRRRWSTVSVALAACLLVVVGARAFLRPRGVPASAVSTRQLAVLPSTPVGHQAGLATAQPVLARGTRLGAPSSGEVRIGAPDGTALALEAGGELTVVDNGPRRQFTLERGAVRAHVAKLSAGERFLIDTPDAEVEVHGTRFRVALVAGRSRLRWRGDHPGHRDRRDCFGPLPRARVVRAGRSGMACGVRNQPQRDRAAPCRDGPGRGPRRRWVPAREHDGGCCRGGRAGSPESPHGQVLSGLRHGPRQVGGDSQPGATAACPGRVGPHGPERFSSPRRSPPDRRAAPVRPCACSAA